MRDITLGDTFYHDFTTRAFATGIPTVLAGTPVLSVLEENNATPITAGVSVSVDRASVVGLNEATIIATSGNGYETGKSYSIYISTGTVGGVSVVGEVVGHFTVEKSSAFIRAGAPAGASVSADVAAIKAETALIVADTNELQTDNVPGLIAALNDISTAQVNTEVDTALTDIGLDHLVSAAVVGADVTDNSIFAKLVSKSATADWDNFVNTTDSLQAIQDNVGTAVAASISADLAVVDTVVDAIPTTAMRGTDSAALASVCTEGRLAELDAANLPADIDAILSDTIALSYVGPRGPGVYLDDGAANTNTVVGVDGIESNAVSTIAAATTIAGSLGIQRIYLVNDSVITLAQTYEGWEFIGIGLGNQVTLGSQDVDNSFFHMMTLTGTQGGTGMLRTKDCSLTALVSLECIAKGGYLSGNNTLRASTLIIFDHCLSAVPGNATPELTFSGGTSNVNFRHHSGGLQINSMGTGDTMSYEADGQIVVDATCTDGDLTVRGNCDITDNAGGAVTITQSAAINAANINAAILPESGVALSNIEFLFVAASDHVTPVTAASGTGVTRSLDGGAFGAGTGTLAEVGNGIYQYDASAADMTGGIITFRFTASGGTPGAPDDRFLTIVTGAGV